MNPNTRRRSTRAPRQPEPFTLSKTSDSSSMNPLSTSSGSILPVVNRALWRPASTQLALEERGRAQATPSSFLSGQLTATASSQQEDGGPALGHSWGPCAASAGLLAAGPRQVAGPRGLLCCGAVTAHVFAGPSKALVDAHGRTEVTVGDRWGTSWPLYPHSPVTACWQDVQTAQRHRRTGTEGML